MRLLFVLCLLAFLLVPAVAQAQDAASFRPQGAGRPPVQRAEQLPKKARSLEPICTSGPSTEVVSHEDVARFSLSRLSDVFEFATDWFAASVSGYHWDAVPADQLPGGPGWDVYVDGVPVSARLLGRSHLNALPIPIADIACIELVSAPDIGGTSFSRFGAIRIYTKDPQFGLTLEASAAAGNEINDPGPFRYTDEGGQNVDRIGPVAAAGVAVHNRSWNVRAAVRTDEYHTTDAVLKDRVRTFFDDPKPRIQSKSAGTSAAFFGQRFLSGITSTRDVAFFEPVGVEIPAHHGLFMAGGSGNIDLSDVHFRYAGAVTRGVLGSRGIAGSKGDARPIDLDWDQRQIVAEADARIHGVRFGGGVRTANVHTDQELTSNVVMRPRLYAGIDHDFSPTWRLRVLLEWERQGDRPSAAAYASTRIRLSNDHAASLIGSYGTVLPDEQGLWMWIGRGYALPQAGAASVSPLEGRTLPRLLTLDAAWRGLLTDDMRGGARVLYRNVRYAHLPALARAHDPETLGYAVRTSYLGNIDGQTAGVRLHLQHTPARLFRHRISYAANVVVSGDEPYRDARARIPAHHVGYTASFAPVDRFSLSTLIRYGTASIWPNYQLLPPPPSDLSKRTSHEIPDYLLVDVSATKRLWEDYVLLSLALRNVLDEPLRRHPAGAVFHMTLRFSVQLRATSTAGFTAE